MGRANIATVSILAILFAAPAARGQSCPCGNGDRLDLRPPDPDVADDPQPESQALLASGATLAIAAFFSSLAVVHAAPQRSADTDFIPFAGTLAAAMRGPNSGAGPLLYFLASAQALGLVMVAAAAIERAEQHRWTVDVDAGPTGCRATLTVRLP